jgi:hypothetical protein
MKSPKQIEASRINGRLTHGPITPQGKYNSSRNNLRHGLLSQTVVLEKESEERFLELLDEYMQTHQPQNVTEAALVETMVIARWRHMRILGMQKLALDQDIALQDPELGPSSVRAMYALRGSPDNPPRPDVLLRYEVTYDRMFKSALRHLESLVRHRKPPVGPYFPAHPSGHNWKDEAQGAFPSRDSHGADLANRDRQEADSELSIDPAPRKTPHAIRPQEPIESTTPPESRRGADPQVRGRRPRRPAAVLSKSSPSASSAEGRSAQAKLRIRPIAIEF